jgi:hypothetical protein
MHNMPQYPGYQLAGCITLAGIQVIVPNVIQEGVRYAVYGDEQLIVVKNSHLSAYFLHRYQPFSRVSYQHTGYNKISSPQFFMLGQVVRLQAIGQGILVQMIGFTYFQQLVTAWAHYIQPGEFGITGSKIIYRHSFKIK